MSEIFIGGVKVELNGKPFVIGVDTFSHEDWLDDYFETNEEASRHAQTTGGEMLKKHAYDKDGKHIAEGGTF